MTYSYTNLKDNIADSNLYSNFISSTTIRNAINRGVRKAMSYATLRSSKRKSALSPMLFDEIYEYSCPTDLNGEKIIDIAPQIGRGRGQYWELLSSEEFDRYKQELSCNDYGDEIEGVGNDRNLVALSNNSGMRTLLLSSQIDDQGFTIDQLDSVGSWTGFGDGENLVADNTNYVKGSASINFDISSAGGTTAGITNSSLSFTLTDYLTEGHIFAWAYLSDKTNVTNFIIRIGTNASNYYSITATSKNDGTAFETGWNLIRFDMSSKSTVGVITTGNYVALYMTKDASKVSETDYRFDQIIIKKGIPYNLYYYSKYLWQTSAGVWIENSTADTDLINADTDELDLIVECCRIEIYRDLKDFDQMKLSQNEVLRLVSNYKINNTSEELSKISKYWDI